MTNRDKLNEMINNELSLFLNPRYCPDCVASDYCDKIPFKDFTHCADTIEKWLESEIAEENTKEKVYKNALCDLIEDTDAVKVKYIRDAIACILKK